MSRVTQLGNMCWVRQKRRTQVLRDSGQNALRQCCRGALENEFSVHTEQVTIGSVISENISASKKMCTFDRTEYFSSFTKNKELEPLLESEKDGNKCNINHNLFGCWDMRFGRQ